jgi:Metallo-peptidase family M12B Reprolysin-like
MGYTSGFGPVSAASQVLRLRFRQIHVNVIRVGSEQFSSADEREIDAAVQFTRDAFARFGTVAIGRVQRFDITTARANGHDIIGTDAEAKALTDEFTVRNGALDAFFVRAYVGTTTGLSAVRGSCDKSDTDQMTGVVVEMGAGGGVSDWSLAHEIGHYLGLRHAGATTDPASSPNRLRLMFPIVPARPYPPNSPVLIDTEVRAMNGHCLGFPAS